MQFEYHCDYWLHNQVVLFAQVECQTLLPASNMTRWNDDVLMLAQRLRRWANIKTSSFPRVLLAGMLLSAVQIDTRYMQHVCVIATLISITVYKLTPTSNILANSDY